MWFLVLVEPSVNLGHTEENREGNGMDLGLSGRCSAPKLFLEPLQDFFCEISLIAQAIFLAAKSILTDIENGLAISIYEF